MNTGLNKVRAVRPVLILVLLLFAVHTVPCAAEWPVSDEELPRDAEYAAERLLEGMSEREIIGQTVLAVPEALTGGTRTAVWESRGLPGEYPVGGMLLYGQNIESAEQLSVFLSDIRADAACCGIQPLYFAATEEGTRGARVSYKTGMERTMPDPCDIANADAAFAAGENSGRVLSGFGITLNLSPVLLPGEDADDEIAERVFPGGARETAALAGAYLAGLSQSGVSGCGLWFGGYASPDAERTGERRTEEELTRGVWQYWRDLDLPFLAVSACSLRQIDNVPACLSRTVVTDILRGRLDYEGIVLADGLDRRAVTAVSSLSKAYVTALNAGVDVIVVRQDAAGYFRSVEAALDEGRISMETLKDSAKRVLAWKIRTGIIR